MELTGTKDNTRIKKDVIWKLMEIQNMEIELETKQKMRPQFKVSLWTLLAGKCINNFLGMELFHTKRNIEFLFVGTGSSLVSSSNVLCCPALLEIY